MNTALPKVLSVTVGRGGRGGGGGRERMQGRGGFENVGEGVGNDWN